jgi:hypothetical protein
MTFFGDKEWSRHFGHQSSFDPNSCTSEVVNLNNGLSSFLMCCVSKPTAQTIVCAVVSHVMSAHEKMNGLGVKGCCANINICHITVLTS